MEGYFSARYLAWAHLAERGLPSAGYLAWLGKKKALPFPRTTEVEGLDFCSAGPEAEVCGLSSGALLACLMEGGRLRLLDPADGRCVAVVPARQRGQLQQAS